ncbi:MAG: hypothetical protein WCP06_14070, partial [Verrucomicrobiota bacterium]
GVSTDGPALSSQYTGGSGVGGQGNGAAGTLSNADLWGMYWSGAGAGSSSSGSDNGSLADDPTISSQYTGGSGIGGITPLVYTPESDGPPVFHSRVFTGDHGSVQFVQTADSGSQNAGTDPPNRPTWDDVKDWYSGPQWQFEFEAGLGLYDSAGEESKPKDQGTGEGDASESDDKSRARSWWGIRGWFLGDGPIDDGGSQVIQTADTGTDGKTTSKSGGSLIATMGDLADDAGSYVGRSSKSLILGDWTDEKPTGLSIGAGIGLGVLGVDLPMDVRDLSHTLTHREWSYEWGETLAYNTIGLIPLIGVLKNLKRLKYLDDAGELAKRTDDAAEAAGDAGRRAPPASDPPSDPPPKGPSGPPSDPPKGPSDPSPDTPSPSHSHTGYSGRAGFELKNHPSQPIRNAPATISDRQFSGHALDQMQNRGIPPSVVDNTIKHGTPFNGNRPGTQGYFDPINRVTVIINSNTGTVITVIRGVR